MLLQTHGEWSAPLDDVFIHFDYARATARGYPFQWSPGNGYSSGNTSVLYPFVLAIGYLAGFRSAAIMIWAGIVACVSVFGLLLAARELFANLSAPAKYAAPLALFSIGALDWSLFSGMEVAFFLGVWGGALVSALRLTARAQEAEQRASWTDWQLGACGILLVLTRPEGAMSIAALGLMVADVARRKNGARAALPVSARTGGPAA